MPDLVWFVTRRLFSALLVMLALSLAVYLVFYAIPADPAHLACGKPCTPDRLEQARHFMQLDQTTLQQYLSFLKGIFAGRTFGDGAAAVHCNAPCFGYSFPLARPVTTLILDRLPVTASIAIGAAILWLLLGVSLGVIAALNRGRIADRATLVGLTVLGAIPSFVGSIVLIAVFAVQLGWFPSFGSGEGFLDTVYHLVLPSIALAVVFVVLVGKVTRSSMVDQLGREHVEVAVSRGLSRGTVVRRHVFRNAVGPILTVSGLLVASSIVEAAFGLAGIGSLLVQSVDRLDFPVVQAIVLLIVAAFVVVNAIVVLLDPWIDPRSAAGAGAR